MVAKHIEIDLERVSSIVLSGLITLNVAQNAKDVLVEPVLLLIYRVKGFDIVEPGEQVSQVVLGIVALTNSKSPEVHELAGGKVCAIAVEEKRTRIKKR